MGLDMYAGTMRTKPAKPVDFEIAEGDLIDTDLHYWRKHPNLHGWMEKLYREKGGTQEVFNCVEVEITHEDLNRLEAAIKLGGLPHTGGFFFGVTDGSEKEDDLLFVTNARARLNAGEFVYYSSWW